MIQRIVLINFMAHEHSVIELGPGLNVLTGPNNTGKSAVVEALRCVTQNPVPKQFIRHGAREARVEVHLEEGWRVVWIRKKAHPIYEVWAPGATEPEIYAKFGRKVPEEVQQLLRMPEVVIDESSQGKGNEIDLHLGNQRYPVFLLDKPGSVFAQFFAASTESTHLLAMQDLLKDKTREARRNLKDGAERQTLQKQGLDRLAPLPWLELQGLHAEELLERIRLLESETPRLRQLVQQLQHAHRRKHVLRSQEKIYAAIKPAAPLLPVAQLLRLLQVQARLARGKIQERGRLTALEPLTAPPHLTDAASLAALLTRLQTTSRLLRFMGQREAQLRELRPPREPFAAAELAGRLQTLRSLQGALQRARTQAQTLAGLTPGPALQETAGPAAMLTELRRTRNRLERLHKTARQAGALAEPPQLQELSPMQQRMQQLRQLRRQRETLRQELEKREQELHAFRINLDARLKELGACPLCGGALDTESFLQKGHVHG